MSDEDRARRRESWPIRRYRLGEEPGDDLTASTTPEERLAMMWPLALDAWASKGEPLPEYSRETMPGRVIGLPPRRIDVLTAITGVDFDTAYATRVSSDGTPPIPFLGKVALLANKRAAGRPKDLADVLLLEAALGES